MYLFPASSCVLSVIVVLLFYPETKGVELEDITRIFDEFYATSPTKRVKIRGGLRTKRKGKGKRSGEKYKAKYNPLSGGGGTVPVPAVAPLLLVISLMTKKHLKCGH